MKKLISVVAVASAIVAAGSLAMASTTTSTTSGFTFSHNLIALTQSDWGSVSGHGYTTLIECPSGQQYVNAFLVSEDTNGAYIFPALDGNQGTSYLHVNGSSQPDGLYLSSGATQGNQGNGTVELIGAN